MSRRERTIETDFFGLPVNPDRINSKVKGNRNELQAATFLFQWSGVKFTRVPSSGGLRWKDAPYVCGDLVCEEHTYDCPFAFETKHLKNVEFSNPLRKNSKVFTIYAQALRDAERAKKLPMVLLRRNGMAKGVYVLYLGAWAGHYGLPMDKCSEDPELYAIAGTSQELAAIMNWEKVLVPAARKFVEKLKQSVWQG